MKTKRIRIQIQMGLTEGKVPATESFEVPVGIASQQLGRERVTTTTKPCAGQENSGKLKIERQSPASTPVIGTVNNRNHKE